jgi:hypothetical protein
VFKPQNPHGWDPKIYCYPRKLVNKLLGEPQWSPGALGRLGSARAAGPGATAAEGASALRRSEDYGPWLPKPLPTLAAPSPARVPSAKRAAQPSGAAMLTEGSDTEIVVVAPVSLLIPSDERRRMVRDAQEAAAATALGPSAPPPVASASSAGPAGRPPHGPPQPEPSAAPGASVVEDDKVGAAVQTAGATWGRVAGRSCAHERALSDAQDALLSQLQRDIGRLRQLNGAAPPPTASAVTGSGEELLSSQVRPGPPARSALPRPSSCGAWWRW